MFNPNFGNPYGMASMPTATQPYGFPMSPFSGGQFAPPQQQQQSTAPAFTNTNKIYVSGIEEVKNRPLPFNSDMLFIDNDKPLVYQKTVDSKGQFEVKVFDITPHEGKDEANGAGAVDLSAYAPKSDLEALQREIRVLKEQVSKLPLHRSQGETTTLRKDGV